MFKFIIQIQVCDVTKGWNNANLGRVIKKNSKQAMEKDSLSANHK